MTFEKRVEAAFDAMAEMGMFPVGNPEARYVLEAAFPELFGPNPTHWLAPMEATSAMEDAATLNTDIFNLEYVWQLLRDAYLKEGK